MHPKLDKKLSQIDHLLDDLHSELKALPDEVLNRKPGPGQWSALQNMHHLMISEQLSERYVRKKLSFNTPIPNAGIAGAVRIFLLNFYLHLPFKFKAPKIVGDEALPDNTTLEETLSAWRANRQSLRELLAGLPDGHIRKALYKHPFAGKLSLAEMLYFFEFHFRRHRNQIRRALDAVM
jgi:hypothetical protein